MYWFSIKGIFIMYISFIDNKKTASLDGVLSERISVSDLTDKKRATLTGNLLKEGTVIYANHNNGLILPPNMPEHNTKGVVVGVQTMSGIKTAMDGVVFVKWQGSERITQAPVTNIRLASKRVANLDGFAFATPNLLKGTHMAVQNLVASKDVLVHKATKDLWSMKVSDDGSFDIERLFDDDGNPLKI
jgi:hypothetical protein